MLYSVKCWVKLAFCASSLSFFATFLFVMGSIFENEHILFNKIASFGNKVIGSTPLGPHRNSIYVFFFFFTNILLVKSYGLLLFCTS